MVQEAQSHSSEDKLRREQVDACNEADSTCYTAEHQLNELSGQVGDTSKSRAMTLVADIRQKIKENAEVDTIKRLTEELKSTLQSIQQEIHAAQAAAPNPTDFQQSPFAGAGSRSSANGARTGVGGDDIVDAEVRPM